MPLKITKGYQLLVAQAEKEIETISVQDALALHGRTSLGLVYGKSPCSNSYPDGGNVRHQWVTAPCAKK